MGVPALASRWSERGGEFQIHAVGVVEGQDRDTESGQVLALTVLDAVPVKPVHGLGEFITRGDGETHVVQANSLGVETIAGLGERAQAPNNTPLAANTTPP